jgi:hypothetical protein
MYINRDHSHNYLSKLYMTDVDCQKLDNCTSIPSTANSYSESNHILVIVFRCFMIFTKYLMDDHPNQ